MIEHLRHRGVQVDAKTVFMKPVLAELAAAIINEERTGDERPRAFTTPQNLIPDLPADAPSSSDNNVEAVYL